MKICELFDKPEKWTKGHSAINKNGNIVTPNDKEAVAWCLRGAMPKCYLGGEPYDIYVKVMKYLEKKTKHTTVVNFNDAVETTFEDIKKLVTDLDI